MRLSKLKLAGFKSFVDYTTLTFPSDRVGVIGPNGCGKSNVIDAVRWVMGESSAKQLRGSAMSDVIFNGSRNRKPVDQAFIELVFENVNVPQYPQQSEIAVKRQITRKGQSVYFINGVKCRRKDITDLFLGTGLGPRSYAIIEQGTISRLIEARPEELRVFFEEAAGISKYKERRRETELRMKHTRENINRLEDIQNELDKQLDKLKKQAKQATKFQELQKSHHLLKAQLQAIRWHALDTKVQEQQQYIDEQAEILAKDLLSLQNFDSTHKQQREAQNIAQSTLTEAQNEYHAVDTEITKLEQNIHHASERCEQLQFDLVQLDRTRDEANQTLATDERQIAELETNITEAEGLLEVKLASEAMAEQALTETQGQLEEWQYNWDAFNQRSAEPTQRAQIERARVENLEQRLEQSKQRLQRLEQENSSLDIIELEQVVADLSSKITAIKMDLEQAEISLAAHYAAVLQLRSVTESQSSQLQEQQAELHKLNGRLASLETLQESALGANNTNLNNWLQMQGLHDAPRLAQSIQVESGWETAVETVLGTRLQALCVEDMTILQEALANPPAGKLAVFEIPNSKQFAVQDNSKLLVDKIQAPWPLSSLLSGVQIADNIQTACQIRKQLAEHESVITPTGLWFGSQWLHSHQAVDEHAGVLARKQEIDEIVIKLDSLNDSVQQLATELEQNRTALYAQENHREQAQQQVNSIRKQEADWQSQHSGKQAQLEHTKAQLQRLNQEQYELNKQISNDETDLLTTRNKLHASLEEMTLLADERDDLTQQRDLYQETVAQTSQTWQAVKDERHKIEVRLESLRTDQSRLYQGIERLKNQLANFTEQRYYLQQNLEKQSAPLEGMEDKLTEYQHKKTEAEEILTQVKQTYDHLEAALNDYDGERHRLESRCTELRADIEQARLECHANDVRRQSLDEQLAELEFGTVALLADLPEYADEASWQAQIEAAERKLEKIGSVNLAALDEFEEQAERKKELDEQTDDLNKAMQALENAIKTIDKETKARFKETIDKVNTFLQEMFPRLFGGGEASLQLIGDDILKAGVTIMARPPGKRNTNIHLLSGGEKALTAIALVFAIFKLNPAPFCMLDEVDAPLDDTNVGRFCALVKAMSDSVQFIFISHNKITMEIANQLIGVTMQEAGVSRLVTVDINTAVEMVS